MCKSWSRAVYFWPTDSFPWAAKLLCVVLSVWLRHQVCSRWPYTRGCIVWRAEILCMQDDWDDRSRRWSCDRDLRRNSTCSVLLSTPRIRDGFNRPYNTWTVCLREVVNNQMKEDLQRLRQCTRFAFWNGKYLYLSRYAGVRYSMKRNGVSEKALHDELSM